MTTAEYRIRCRLSESSLPAAPYRAMLTKLHREMLSQIEADGALLWLARELVRELPIVHPQQGPRRNQLIQALNQRL